MPTEVVRPVRMVTIGQVAGDGALELPGSVHAERETELAFEVGGRIIELLVEDGTVVTSEQTLARLDPRDYLNARDSARASRNSARATYERYLEASRSNAVTQQDVDTAKRDLEVADADLKIAEKALEETALRAPFAGRIAAKLVSDFENVQAKQGVFILHDESSLEIHVAVAERDWARGSRDLSVDEVTALLQPRVEVSALPGRLYPARAKTFATAVDPVTRTYEATFGFDPPAGNSVSPGMTAKLYINPENLTESAASTLNVPAAAVFTPSDGEASVWTVDSDGRVSRQRITLGPLVSGQLSVTAGLRPGSRIAVTGVHTLVEGQRVRDLKP
ncbi:MAG: efflux RND transporter periplasmic adaptor subunit [Pseudomonadota bacterium]